MTALLLLLSPVPSRRTRPLSLNPCADDRPRCSRPAPHRYGRAKTVADNTVLAGKMTERQHDRDSQIAAIEASFEAASRKPQHPTKRNVRVLEEYPIFPDFKLWKNLFYEAMFGERRLLPP